jgi:hypothetical protein
MKHQSILNKKEEEKCVPSAINLFKVTKKKFDIHK